MDVRNEYLNMNILYNMFRSSFNPTYILASRAKGLLFALCFFLHDSTGYAHICCDAPLFTPCGTITCWTYESLEETTLIVQQQIRQFCWGVGYHITWVICCAVAQTHVCGCTHVHCGARFPLKHKAWSTWWRPWECERVRHSLPLHRRHFVWRKHLLKLHFVCVLILILKELKLLL